MKNPILKHIIAIPSIIVKISAFVALVLICWYLYPNRNHSLTYLFEEGRPWNYELVTAQFDFPIYKSDEQLHSEQEDILKSYTPYYTLKEGSDESLLVLAAKELEMLKGKGYKGISVVSDNHVAQVVDLSLIHTPKTAYQLTGSEFTPNLVYDENTSELVKSNLLSKVSPTQGMVQTGQKIIDRGEIISPTDYQILISLIRAFEEKNVTRNQALISDIGFCCLLSIILFMLIIYLLIFRKTLWQQERNILFFVLIIGIVVVLFEVIMRHWDNNYIYLVPFAWVAVITRVFYDSRTAFMLSLTTILIASIAAPIPLMFFFMQICACGVAVASLKDMSQRAQLAKTAGLVFLTYAIGYTVFILATTGNFGMLNWRNYVCFAVNAVLLICSYGLIYLLEKLFHLVSNITLIELTNMSSDLMMEFAEKAPGTFQHSLQVSNLAIEAAKRIGAKSLLVRTGALYHDIGKLWNPDMYTENQTDGINPLLDMSPAEAAQTVIKHVAEGESIARKHHLPQVIINFIVTHHGTSLVRYFYHTECNAHPGETIDKTPFQYAGPRPTTKEGAILMMADAIEARSRSLSEYTEEKIHNMVEDMIEKQVQDGQFADTPLSFRDLEQIKACFKERLITIYHHRIQYPNQEK